MLTLLGTRAEKISHKRDSMRSACIGACFLGISFTKCSFNILRKFKKVSSY